MVKRQWKDENVAGYNLPNAQAANQAYDWMLILFCMHQVDGM